MPSFLPALAELEGRGHKVGGEIPPISSLFSGLANLAVEVSPGAGDYIAGKRALEAYGNMGEMMQQGQYMDAASYGAQGLTEQISTIPALGEIATGAKMFAAGVGALKGFPNARPDWIHGSPRGDIDKLNEPVFLTKDPYGAEFFSKRSKGSKEGGVTYPYRYEPANALDLDTTEGLQEFLEIAEKTGVEINIQDAVSNSWKISDLPNLKSNWNLYIPELGTINKFTENEFDLLYLPKVRKAVRDAGYDAVRGQDILQDNYMETLVPLYPERLVPAYSNKLDHTAQRVADQLMLSEMPSNYRIGRSYGEKKSWYANENEGSWGDGIWGWGTTKEEAIADYRTKWVNRYKETGAKTFGETEEFLKSKQGHFGD